VFLGGVLSEGPGWRWVMFVNLPVCLIVLASTVRLIPREGTHRSSKGFDARGAVLVTAGMLALVYTLVEAPGQGWSSVRTLGGLAAALLLLAAFVVNEQRARAPLAPLEIFKINGLGAANVTQLVGVAGMVSMFFFLTLYMQGVLGYSQIQAGAAYLPLCFGVIVAAGITSQLLARIGTRPVIVAGALISAAGVYLLSRVPLHGTYVADLLPGLLVASLGLGTVFVGVTTAANSGVSADKAGLAAALLNTSQQLGAALGLAIFTAIATSRTNDLVAAGTPGPEALTSGVHRALLLCSFAIVAAAVIGLRATNTRGEVTLPSAPRVPERVRIQDGQA
jgi:predicted MFS family arabinose efflux permease